MNSKPIKSDVKLSEPIVKLSWMWHNREYQIGIKRFLAELDVDVSDEDINKAVRKILSSN